ncbi:DNA-processing protein DprA [Vibrio sp. DW001]|uniref:DNA-processing protein DprA n=1 Tax=Vibrio sp. DW001 TaxID=2912315 RepID=UPI0023AFA39A|nr:DNA-processing protein DprA [Vibrio sp. DW001]WED26658.1 DNA-processing protein DprA [Vibrio sp. DW001]
MCEKTLSAWLTLSFTPYIGSRNFSKLVAISSPENIVSFSRKELEYLGLKPQQIDYIKRDAAKDVDYCLSWQQSGSANRVMTLIDNDYPELLKKIGLPPPILFIKGDVDCLSEPQIAIVGSRNASVDGLNNAKAFSGDLARKGITITSGLALGIDGHAHDGALKAGGKTIAVLGSGLESIYPAKHRDLSERIIENGALVSEFRPNGLPKPEHFPRRNRIISGLSLGVLIVEAAQKSGSLITARYANDQGREVFALPGSIHNPHAKGGNSLIKEGASLVQSSSDMLKEIDSLLNWSINNQRELFSTEDEKEQLPFSALLANVGGEEAVSVDILAQRTHIPVNEIMMQLLELELQGHVAAVSGGYIRTRRG